MKVYNASKSQIFFLELLLALLLLVFTSFILLGVFGKANTLRVSSKNETRAMIELERLVEEMKGNKKTLSDFPLYYSEDFEEVKKETAYFQVGESHEIEAYLGGRLIHSTLAISKVGKEDVLWELEFTTYRKK